jgi:fructose-bisphosphate aldolase class I
MTPDFHALQATAQVLMAPGKGLLAMDESTPTCNKRFEKLGIEPSVEKRRAYRELIATTPGLDASISGAILYDETVRQLSRDGTPLIRLLEQAGIMPGIKVDQGTKALAGHPGEKITEGLDGLRERLAEYARMGARFAKWRAVITIGEHLPTRACIAANAHALARYAALCQEAGLVPIVEPEVLMDGDHSLDRCFEVTEATLRAVFDQLYAQRVAPEGLILKPNMVLPGQDGPHQASLDDVAEATVACLKRAVPAAVPGVAFLSGGQSSEAATAHLNAMNAKYGPVLPWRLTFSFSRAIQQSAMAAWKGEDAHLAEAQRLLAHWSRCAAEASAGRLGQGREPNTLLAGA